MISVSGGGGQDSILGGSGGDNLFGGNGADSILGGTSSDQIEGGAGADTLQGGTGNDLMRGDGGNDRIFGGTGDDELYGLAGSDSVEGGTGNDFLAANDSDGVDTLVGGVGNDVYEVTSSNHLIVEESGGGVDGAAIGFDWLDGTFYDLPENVEGFEVEGSGSWRAEEGVISINLVQQGNVDAEGGGLRVFGSADDDWVSVQGGDNTITGGGGGDTLWGGVDGGVDVFAYNPQDFGGLDEIHRFGEEDLFDFTLLSVTLDDIDVDDFDDEDTLITVDAAGGELQIHVVGVASDSDVWDGAFLV